MGSSRLDITEYDSVVVTCVSNHMCAFNVDPEALDINLWKEAGFEISG